MYYFPFVELIEKAIKKMRELGGWVFWLSAFVGAMIGYVALRLFEVGNSMWRYFLVAYLLYGVIGYFIARHHDRRNDENDSSDTSVK